jgi:ribosomal protein S18 acetylase RimI-like enzyme
MPGDPLIRVVQVTRITDELVSALARLIPQLDAAAPLPTREHLERVVRAPECALLVARDDTSEPGILGALTLVRYPVPTGVRVWIEDMIVDSEARQRGVGAALMSAALDRARREGGAHLDLTSRPEREAANRFYQRIGFHQRTTNVYRYQLDECEG